MIFGNIVRQHENRNTFSLCIRGIMKNIEVIGPVLLRKKYATVSPAIARRDAVGKRGFDTGKTSKNDFPITVFPGECFSNSSTCLFIANTLVSVS